MKKFAKHAMTTSAVFAMAFGATAFAEPPTGRSGNYDQPKTGITKMDSDAQDRFHCCKAEELMGKNVKDRAGKDIGSVKDIAIDPQTGRIAYGVLSFGGFMGMGDKLFAVPWSSFERGTDDGLVLNVNKQQLENAQGFNDDAWPNMADQRWATQTHTAFGAKPYWDGSSAAHSNNRDNTMPKSIVRASNLTGTAVKNAAGDEIATIDDLIVDHSADRIAATLITSGGFLGIGSDTYMVPFTAFNVVNKGDGELLVTGTLTKEQMKNAPKFVAASDFENRPAYLIEVYRFYNVPPYWNANDATYNASSEAAKNRDRG